jgi:hypothetical protein
MNKFFTLAVALVCIIHVRSQAQSPEMTEINPRSFAYDKKLAFARIDIIDSRYDTTKIGYAPKGSSLKKLTLAPFFSAGIQNSLNTSLQSSFDLSKNASLVIVVKNFWLKNAFIKKQTEYGSQCAAKLELYLKTDSAYFPLIRIDTVFTHDEPLKNSGSELVMLPFEQSLVRLEKINLEKPLSSTKLTWKNIEEFNEKRFRKPIYSASLQKGIYLTFKDFLENRADKRPFEINFGKLTDQLYLIQNDDKKVFTEFWAVCDGNKLYINSGLNFYELVRTDKGFEFWGDEEVDRHSPQATLRSENTSPQSIATGMANYGTDKLLNSKKNSLRPFQINMENGSVY